MNRLFRIVLVLMVLGATGAIALGADAEPAVDDKGKQENEPWASADWPSAIAIVGACLAAALCTIGGVYAIAVIGGKCIESIARQPEAAGTMFMPMVIAAGMVEGGMLFGIVVCLMAVMRAIQ